MSVEVTAVSSNATEFIKEREIYIRQADVKPLDLSGRLMTGAMIGTGAIVTLCWIAFLGWAGGKLVNLW